MTIWITWRSEHILTFRMSQNYKYSVAEGSSSEWAMHVTWQQNIYREVLYQRIRQFLQTANFTKKWKTYSNTYQWRQYIDKTKQTQPFADVFQKSVLKNYAIFLKTCNFAKKRPPTYIFSCEYCENFQKSVLYRILSVAASDKTSVKTRSLHILIPLSSLDSQYAYWIKFHQGHFASSLES